MTDKERAVVMEMHEAMIAAYRNMASQVAQRCIPDGFDQPVSDPESAYGSQLRVAWLGCLIQSKVLPILDVVHTLAKQTGGIEMLINRELARFDTDMDMEVDYFPDLAATLMMAVSRAETANGLPPCCFTKDGEAP